MHGHHQDGNHAPPPPSAADLPFEIIYEIVSYITSQSDLYATALISRRYNIASTPLLYAHPSLTSSNIDRFVATVAPTINPHPKKNQISGEYHLSDLVQTLNLSPVLFSDTLRTAVTRLLTHCRNITSFTGPQKSFSGTAVRALRHSTKLQHLDLRPCYESLDLVDFFHTFTFFPHLKDLHFPSSSLFPSVQKINGRWHSNSIAESLGLSSHSNKLQTTFTYPPGLTTLTVAGGIVDGTLLASGTPPTSITSFSACNLPFVRMTALRQYINNIAPQLTYLSILHPIPRLPHNFLDRILITCPNLLHLTASVDFMTAHLFDEENCTEEHPIERIDLDCSGGIGSEFKVSSDDIWIALMEGRLKKLRIVRASVKLGWGRKGGEMDRVKDLAEVLCMDRSGLGEDEEEEEDMEGSFEKTGSGEESDIDVKEEVEDLVGREGKGDGEDDLSTKLAGVWLF
ncbi:hypothetical protein ABW19_dt0207262 [Dactylella cylindrospora]|nr:hypothetical protein ABW19_dt0207262 [Dactylella cylindrospora]